jgi:hypothetical protein
MTSEKPLEPILPFEENSRRKLWPFSRLGSERSTVPTPRKENTWIVLKNRRGVWWNMRIAP